MLTDRQLAALKAPKAGRAEFPDGTGLVVRVTATGTKTFGVWWRVPKKFGGAEQKGFYTIGTTDSVGLADAREQAKRILELARKGLNPVEELRRRETERKAEAARRANLTVLAVVERHLGARSATLRPTTLSQYEYTLRTLRESPLAAKQLLDVRRGEVREALRAIRQQRGSGSARKVKTLVRAAARWAAAEDLLPHDVLAGLTMPEIEPQARDRVLPDDEIVALWQACEDAPPIMAASVRLQLLMALRHPSETAGMRWDDLHKNRVDGIGEVLVYDIPSERRKHGIPLALPVPPLAAEILEGLKPLTGSHDLVLHGWSRGRELHWWRRTIKRRVTTATGATNFTRHDLRRSAASGMCRIGVSVHAADTVLGHVVKGSGRSYIHGARLVEAASALWRWNKHLEVLLAPAADQQQNVVAMFRRS
ncbi:MAG TPA: integrase family protein [Vicinamibacteria bacterium]|nr:integrase family protein [Vicinamibacteria bacterium]